MKFKTELKVRSYECDMYGHVNNSVFLNYLEIARVEFLNKMGYDLKSLMKSGFILPIVKIEIEYKRPAFAGELVEISVEWIKRGRTSSVFFQEIKNGKDQLLASAQVTWVVANLESKPVSIPAEIIENYEKAFKVKAPEQSREY